MKNLERISNDWVPTKCFGSSMFKRLGIINTMTHFKVDCFDPLCLKVLVCVQMTLSRNIAILTQHGVNVKRNWLLSIFAIALGMLSTSSMAQCTSSGGTISTALTSTCTLNSGTLTITETGSISTTAYAYAGVSGEARSGQTLYGGSIGLRMAF